MFADVYGAAAARKLNQSARSFLAGREKPSKDSASLAVGMLAMARTLPDNSPCFSTEDSSKCQQDVGKINMDSAAFEQTGKNVVKELQGKGILPNDVKNLGGSTK